MMTTKTANRPTVPVFAGRYAQIRKAIWKKTVGAPFHPGAYMGGKDYQTESGFRNAAKKRFLKEMKIIDQAETATLPQYFDIVVEWGKGSMGANQARAILRFGSDSIVGDKTRGVGYDKESTAVADVLNQASFARKIALDNAKSTNPYYGTDNMDTIKRYGYAPAWNGGVGMGSFRRILERAGYEEDVHYSDKFTLYQYRRKKGRK